MTVRRINLYVDAETDALLDEMVEADKAEHGVSSRSAVIRRALREMGARERAEYSEQAAALRERRRERRKG